MTTNVLDSKGCRNWRESRLKHAILCFLFLFFTATVAIADDVAALREKSGQGDAEAQYRLGKKYASGELALPGDSSWYYGRSYPKEAVVWFEKAAAQGHTDAMFSLANHYAEGSGIEQDSKKAFFWYYLAALANPGQYTNRRDIYAFYLSDEDIAEVEKQVQDWSPTPPPELSGKLQWWGSKMTLAHVRRRVPNGLKESDIPMLGRMADDGDTEAQEGLRRFNFCSECPASITENPIVKKWAPKKSAQSSEQGLTAETTAPATSVERPQAKPSPTGDADPVMSALKTIQDNQSRMENDIKSDIKNIEARLDTMQAEITRLKNPALSDLDRAQSSYAENLTQGGSYWRTTSFKVNGDGTATLIGSGTAVLDSGSSSNNAGNGALMFMTFTDLNDPLFKKCRPLLEKTFTAPSTVSTTLEVFGQGSYLQGPADPKNSGNITTAFVFRLGKLTQCKMRKL